MNYLLPIHITLSLTGEGILALALILGLVYWTQAIRLKRKKIFLRPSHIPSLEKLDDFQSHLLWVGFVSLSVGIIVGIYWATRQVGWAWVVDPRQLWMFLGWIVYGIILKARYSRGFRGKKVAMISLIGFALILFANWHGWFTR